MIQCLQNSGLSHINIASYLLVKINVTNQRSRNDNRRSPSLKQVAKACLVFEVSLGPLEVVALVLVVVVVVV